MKQMKQNNKMYKKQKNIDRMQIFFSTPAQTTQKRHYYERDMLSYANLVARSSYRYYILLLTL